MNRISTFVICLIAVLTAKYNLMHAQSLNYQVPPQSILELADIKLPPYVLPDKGKKRLLLFDRPTFKSLEEIAEDELRLAGIRVNPANHNTARTSYYTGVKIMDIATGKLMSVIGLPAKLRIEYLGISPKNTYLSFVNVLEDGLELWIIELATGRVRNLTSANLSGVFGMPYVWSQDEQKLLVRWRPENAKPLNFKDLPTGPAVQEATGSKAPARTYQDLLRNPSDEKKFDYYATTEIWEVSVSNGLMHKFLPSGIYKGMSFSPDGKYLLTSEIHKPYSYQLPLNRFPYKVNMYEAESQKLLRTIANKPLQENIPNGFDAVETGPRNFAWRADMPSTLYWVEAQDGGDPTKETSLRDYLYSLAAPFNTAPKHIASTQNRFNGITWGNDNLAVMEDYWWKTRNTKTYIINPSEANLTPKILFDRSEEDLYADPGGFVTEPNELGRYVLKFSEDGSSVYLQGLGYSPEGNKPFLDELNLATAKAKRLWQADGLTTYENIYSPMDIAQGTLLTRVESKKQNPNFFVRNFKTGEVRQLTQFKSPYTALEQVKVEKVFYKRPDGVELYATLYLPAGYDPAKDGKLPVLMHAYPSEFKDDKAAAQVKDSPHQFTPIGNGSPVFWVTRGYAVLDDAQFPIIGKGSKEPNDSYIEQLVANAKAAIDKLDEMGVGDPKRVAVMGHSYGGFMTANLLAHSNLFAAGIARSGAYNRTLTPFGFQSEERNYWEAQKVYNDMAPYNYADKIKNPLLFIHGDADNNPGTFTLQSERMFQAIKGLGGTARLVLLPFESHGYAARENVLHVLWETDQWLERHVTNKK